MAADVDVVRLPSATMERSPAGNEGDSEGEGSPRPGRLLIGGL
jgi:hypothetical protein